MQYTPEYLLKVSKQKIGVIILYLFIPVFKAETKKIHHLDPTCQQISANGDFPKKIFLSKKNKNLPRTCYVKRCLLLDLLFNVIPIAQCNFIFSVTNSNFQSPTEVGQRVSFATWKQSS